MNRILVYKTRREKYSAVIEKIEELRNAGRPVLVGTTSVEVSELLVAHAAPKSESATMY